MGRTACEIRDRVFRTPSGREWHAARFHGPREEAPLRKGESAELPCQRDADRLEVELDALAKSLLAFREKSLRIHAGAPPTMADLIRWFQPVSTLERA